MSGTSARGTYVVCRNALLLRSVSLYYYDIYDIESTERSTSKRVYKTTYTTDTTEGGACGSPR